LKGENKDTRIARLEGELERARQEIRSFSYSVSHDLRAPLRAIEGFSRILAEDYGQNLDAEGTRFLNHIIHNTQVMSELIEGLLNYHRLNEKPVAKTSVNLTEVARDVVAAVVKPSAASEVKIRPLPTVCADPALVRTMFEHLLSNAVKFSKRKTPQIIELGSNPCDGECIIWIKDNGVGFDMRYSDKLFQVFQKLQKEPDFPGNGIGLAMVRRIVERHQGRVWAESEPEKGATFYVALPNK
jgi:light-regulated signal transduction histidine kinase (bacteriophytochrome)